MNRVKVALYRSTKFAVIDLDALGGAALGVNLFYNGKLLRPEEILNSFAPTGQQFNTGNGDLTTDIIYEGSNLYFTEERAQDAAGAMATNSANVTLTYDDAANTLTADLTETGVVAGNYGGGGFTAVLTIDEWGRIVEASEEEIDSGGGTGAITGNFINNGLPLTGAINGCAFWVPYDFTITSWHLGGDGAVGSGTVDVQTSTDQASWTSITAAAIPAASSARTATSSTLTGWTTTSTGGTWMRFVGSGWAGWTSASIELTVDKS